MKKHHRYELFAVTVLLFVMCIAVGTLAYQMYQAGDLPWQTLDR